MRGCCIEWLSLTYSDHPRYSFLLVRCNLSRALQSGTSRINTQQWPLKILIENHKQAGHSCSKVLSSLLRSNRKFRQTLSGWCENTMSDHAWRRCSWVMTQLPQCTSKTKLGPLLKLAFARNITRYRNQPPPLNSWISLVR